MACLLKNEPASPRRGFLINSVSEVVIGKPSLNRAFVSYTRDPKPYDLSMARLNPVEIREEDRTR
jgi:hypothetical protein